MDPWILDEGVKLARAVTPEAKEAGFQITLGGSVLLKGKSDKDIDLFFIPTSKNSKPSELITVLTRLWGQPTRIDLRYEDRTRHQVQDEQEYLNSRFNSAGGPPRMRGGWVGAATSPLGSVNGTPVEQSEIDDYFVTPGELGLQSLPRGYSYVRRGGAAGRISVVMANDQETPFEDAFMPFTETPDGPPSVETFASSITGSAEKKDKAREPFRHALMFTRAKDRIDVFIV